MMYILEIYRICKISVGENVLKILSPNMLLLTKFLTKIFNVWFTWLIFITEVCTLISVYGSIMTKYRNNFRFIIIMLKTNTK